VRVNDLYEALGKLMMNTKGAEDWPVVFEDGISQRWYGTRDTHHADDGEGGDVLAIRSSTMVTAGNSAVFGDWKRTYISDGGFMYDHRSRPWQLSVKRYGVVKAMLYFLRSGALGEQRFIETLSRDESMGDDARQYAAIKWADAVLSKYTQEG